MRQVHVDGLELEVVEEGEGTPVVFSHGRSADLRYWEPQRAAFASRYRFVAYTRRFHGTRSWPAGAVNSTEAHVGDLLALIRQLQAGPVHLVGFATAIALHAALQAPALVRTLTLVEPHLPWLLQDDPDGQALLAWWRAENERVKAEAAGDVLREAQLAFELVNNWGPGAFAKQDQSLRQMWLDNFPRRRPLTPSPQPLTRDHLSALSMPVLLIGAEHSHRYARRILDVLADCIPASRRVVVPRVTHFMSYQQPAVFNEILLDFLAMVGEPDPVLLPQL